MRQEDGGLKALSGGSPGWTDCFSISHLTKASALFKFNLLLALARTKHISISQASAADGGCCFKREERIMRGKKNVSSFCYLPCVYTYRKEECAGRG